MVLERIIMLAGVGTDGTERESMRESTRQKHDHANVKCVHVVCVCFHGSFGLTVAVFLLTGFNLNLLMNTFVSQTRS